MDPWLVVMAPKTPRGSLAQQAPREREHPPVGAGQSKRTLMSKAVRSGCQEPQHTENKANPRKMRIKESRMIKANTNYTENAQMKTAINSTSTPQRGF